MVYVVPNSLLPANFEDLKDVWSKKDPYTAGADLRLIQQWKKMIADWRRSNQIVHWRADHPKQIDRVNVTRVVHVVTFG